MKLLEALQWRYAVKKMNGTKVPAEKLETIIEIGVYLDEYYVLYLEDFLESNIECYIDVNNSYENKAWDYYADFIDKILDDRNKIYRG